MWKNVYDVYIENNIEKEIQEWVNSLDLKQAEEQPDSSAEAQQPTMGRFLYLCRFGYE